MDDDQVAGDVADELVGGEDTLLDDPLEDPDLLDDGLIPGDEEEI